LRYLVRPFVSKSYRPFGPVDGVTSRLLSVLTVLSGVLRLGIPVAEARTSTPVTKPDASIGRRVGYAVGVVVNVALLYLVNVWPGWRSITFVTEDAEQVLTLLNASLSVGVIANLIYIVFDRAWVKALGDLVTVAISLVLLARIWEVFPFAFDDAAVDWASIVRVVLAVSMVGCVVALVVQLVVLVREVSRMVSANSNDE